MRAWLLDDSPGEYHWSEEVADPACGPGDVAVAPVMSALNHMDLWLTRGRPRPRLPHVPGCDVAGVVDAVGEGVDPAWIGSEVVVNPAVSCRACPICLDGDSALCPELAIVGEHRWGGHGELVVVPQANVVRRPSGRTWAECAAFGLVTLTAWRMLRRARLAEGEVVIVTGAGGGVASAAIAVARHLGAHVIATTREPAKADMARAMGAHEVIGSGDERWPAADVVVDSIGPATWDLATRALRRGGRLVTCGGTSGPIVELDLPRLFFRQHEIIGSTMGSYGEFDQVVAAMSEGLAVAVDSVLGLERYPDALHRLAEGHHHGKIVLDHRERSQRAG